MDFYKIVISSLLLLSVSISSAQNLELVQDYNPGNESSVVDGRLNQYLNSLIYLGTAPDGELGIYQYDKHTDEVNLLLRDSDLEYELSRLSTNGTEVSITSNDGSTIKSISRSYKRDLSDLSEFYTSENGSLDRVFYRGDKSVIMEAYVDDLNIDKINVLSISQDRVVTEILSDLPGRVNDYQIVVNEDYIFIAPEVEVINGENLLIYSFSAGDFIPITDVLPFYQDCGLIQRMFLFDDRFFLLECNSQQIYDLSTNQELNIDPASFLYQYSNDDYLFYKIGNSLYKYEFATGFEDQVVNEILQSRWFENDFVAARDNGGDVEMILFNFDKETYYNYPAGVSSDGFNDRFTGFGVVPSGIHLVMYNFSSDTAVLVRINETSFDIIDPVYNVNFNNSPVAYEEDIYISHQDPDFGNELFVIDYISVANKEVELDKMTTISPNPSSSVINVNYDDIDDIDQINILNASGQVVLENLSNVQINISRLSKGMYFLQTKYKKGAVQYAKFMKM